MLNTNGRRRIIAVLGGDEQSRNALKEVRRWQATLRCRVELMLVWDAVLHRHTEREREVERLCAWARAEAELRVEPEAVVACAAEEVTAQLVQLHATRRDLVVCPGSQDPATSIAALPVHALWSSAAACGASMLLSNSARPVRRVLVVTDGSARTLPVLQSAFALADDFDIQLSHVDTLRMRASVPDDLPATTRPLTPAGRSAQAYTRLVHGLVRAIQRAQHDVRPDVLLLGASAEEGGGLASALCATPMPCSALIVPL